MTTRDRLKAMLPDGARAAVRGTLVKYGEFTADQRPLPDFLIIGTKRGGTTSLWRYLLQHPLVPHLFPAWNTKTSHYLEDNHHRGETWYRSHFPTTRQRHALEKKHGAPPKAGEAAPLYMYHPLAATRAHTLIPNARIIVLLRDPVERAWSHWKERRTEGTEPLDFPQALTAEPTRTRGEREKLIADPTYTSNAYDWYSYQDRGHYLHHLQPWLHHYPREQILVIPSETLYTQPATTYQHVLHHIGLPDHHLDHFPIHNDRPSTAMDPTTRQALTTHYQPHNHALSQTLGMTFDWAAPPQQTLTHVDGNRDERPRTGHPHRVT